MKARGTGNNIEDDDQPPDPERARHSAVKEAGFSNDCVSPQAESVLEMTSRESSSSNANQYYLQNDPGRIDAIPNNSRISFDINNNSNNLLSNISNISNAATNGLASNITNNDSNISKEKRRRRTKDTGKDSKKKRRRNRKKRAERLAQQQRQQQLLYEQRLAEQALHLPSLTPVLEKKTLYPLSYDDFEAYLRSQRAVEYLNFWADVTAHEQLCRTFDVSERRHKREQQLEERAIARDKRRTALLAAMEAGRFTPDPYLLAPGHYTVSPSTSAIGFGSGIGIGIGASGQDIHGSNMYATSRSSLQLPLNDHLSFPPETRRYGLHDSSTPFPPPSHPHSTTGSYNRLLTGAGGTGRVSGEMSRPSLEEEHISEQDAAVAAVAMRAQRNEYYPFNPSREDVRRGSFDLYQSLHGGGLTNMRYQHNNSSNGYVDSGLMPPPSSYSAPNAYNMMMRGRGSVDVRSRSNSRNSRSRPSVTEEYYGNGVRRMSSQQFQQQQNPHVSVHDENGHPHLSPPNGIQRTSQDEHGDSPEAAPVTTTDISLRQQTSQYSIEFAEPELGRRPSRARFGDGSVGPFQPSAAVRRSGESAYAPSHFSTGAMESKTILVQSFRTISLEDLQESALRIYRKYLIQLRTASMAAEEEAAAASADRDQYDNVVGRYKRSSVDKAMAMAPGWDGYAEEVIAQWNESWKGRSREARRSRQLSGRRSISTRGGTHDRDRETNGQPSAVSEETSSQLDRNSSDGGHGHGGGFNINTRAEDKDKDSEDDQSNDDEDKDSKERKTRRGREGKSSVPDSPKSPRLRKKTGTGLSAMLNPLFSRLIKTETTVVELPTLTINTTTIEEATAGDESDDEDEDEDEDEEYDEDEDYDSDEEDDDDDDKNNDENQNDDDDGDARKSQRHRKAMEENVAMDPGPLQPTVASTKDQGQYEVVVEVRDRSVPSLTPSHAQGSEQNQHQQMDQATPQNVTMESNDPENGMGTNNSETLAGSACTPRRQSTASTLSSSWDRIIKRDLDKQEAILPPPISTSLQPSPNRRSGLLGVRSTTGKATKSASRTARRVGSHLSALLNKSVRGGSSSSSLDIIPVTPATPRTNPQRLDNYRFQIPSIVMENPGEEKEFKDVNEKGDHSTLKDGHPLSMSASGANSSFVQLQGESMGTSAISEKVTDNSGIEGGSTLQPPKQILSPTTSSVQASISSSPVLSPTATTPALPRPSVSSPAAVAVSAAAAAFYLPLECRQRIHTQVQEEGRTNTPYLFGPAKGFVMDVVLDDHYYPMFLKYVERHNLGLLNRQHPNNVIKRKGMIWLGILIWLVVLGIQLMLVLMGLGGWSSPWVWVVGIVGGWTGSICLATGVKEFSPILGILGKMCEDRHLFRFRGIQEPSIRVRHRFRAYWMLSYCIFWSTIIMVVFAALPQRNINN
ncbi:hypothetical protein BGZ51_004539 [Haplosporangium sp. Z 767]|nr:hypothetical protein BGZ51_004539 [Haplosporangium sp. Z 767]